MLSFNILAELTTSVTRNKIKNIEILKEAGDQKKRVNRLYNGLLKKEFKTDKEAAMAIFGTDESNVQYRKLRIKLFDLLINTAFFTDGNLAKFPEVTKAQYSCYRNFAAANILLGISAQEAAAYLLKRALEKSIKFELTSLAAEISWLLRTRIKNLLDRKEMNRYIKINEEYEQKRRMEMEATFAYEDLVKFFMGGRATSREIYQSSAGSFKKLFAIAPKVDTAQFYYLTYNIGVAHFMAGNDCKSALDLCLNAIKLIEKRDSSNAGKLVPFATNALACYTQLKILNTPETQKMIKKCYNLSPEFGINRIKVMEIEIYHYLYSQEYEKALKIYQISLNHPRKSLLKGANAEIWNIFAGYFYLMAKLELLASAKVREAVGEFDTDSIDYKVKEFKKEKEGMNIPVLMLPVLTGVLEDQIEGHVRTREAIIQYAKRYLKKKKNVRSAAMLDALLAIDNYQFANKPSLKTIRKTLKLFADVPIELSEQSSAIEILPYETLLELICKRRNIPLGIS